MAFRNQPIAGVVLVRAAIQSNPFVSGSTGWSINRDGTAEFNSVMVRGSVVVGPSPGAHVIVDSVSDAILVYDASNSLIGSISPKAQTVGGVAVSLGFQVFRSSDHNIYARMFDDQVEFHDTTTIPGSTPGSISNANQTANSGTTYLQLVSGTAPTKQGSIFNCVGETADGAFPAYLAARQQSVPGGALIPGQVVQTDAIVHAQASFMHHFSGSGTTDANGKLTIATGAVLPITAETTAYVMFDQTQKGAGAFCAGVWFDAGGVGTNLGSQWMGVNNSTGATHWLATTLVSYRGCIIS